MKMKGRKALVFWVINIQLIIIYFVTLFINPEVSKIVGGMIIISVIGNGATYITGNIAHAWQKSKYYKPALDDKNKVTFSAVPTPDIDDLGEM